jgi:serine/tyrosine/threonine adenylyltransferase
MPAQFRFDNTYAALPERFYARVLPTPVSTPSLVRVNDALAAELGLSARALGGDAAAAVFAGNVLPDGADPIAQAYAGHQFGTFVPQLGDGRAILLGEVVGRDGVRRDIQLKGSGRTPFSRGGDGRAAVGPVLREYVVSEAMAALGIPTTRALAVVMTGEHVARETMLPGAVLTRVAASHIRVGTFQFFASRGDAEGVRLLADYTIARHYPDAAGAGRPYRALLDAVIAAQADLISSWLLVGFIHGVMNTDNASIAGETIDYGPCAFMDQYHPLTVYSAIDRGGRYAYINQPDIGEWNLVRFAECLLPLLDEDIEAAVDDARDALAAYPSHFNASYDAGLRLKLGLFTQHDDDAKLARDLLKVMADNGADFTLTFRRLCDAADGARPVDGTRSTDGTNGTNGTSGTGGTHYIGGTHGTHGASGTSGTSGTEATHGIGGTGADAALRELFVDAGAIDAWLARWRARLQREPGHDGERAMAMRRVNPAFIPRNHRVEAVIRAAVDDADYAPFETLLQVLSRPYDDQPEHAMYATPPQDHERVLRTFCGT